MKKRYVVNILNIILILILLLSVSFSWMTDEMVKYSRWIGLEYNTDQLFVMAHDLEVSLHVKVRNGSVNEDDDYDDFSNASGREIFTAENFAPGDYLQYRLDITTYSKIQSTIQVTFAGIDTNSSEISDKLIIGTTRFAGYWLGEETPAHVVGTIGDKLNNGAFVFFDKLQLPAIQSASSRKISIYWYIFFDRTATDESANKYFKIPHLYIISV